jgi:hypothetical protein
MGANLQGLYDFKQGLLNNNLQTLQIKRRRSDSSKPQFYLVFINPDDSEVYISSLYDHQVDWTMLKHYQFDFEGHYYILAIDDWYNKAEIKKIGLKKARTEKRRYWGEDFGGKRRGTRNSPNAINNGELGTKIVPKW